MRFSVSLPYFVDPSSDRPLGAIFEMVQTAERWGYDTVTIGHHHFQPGYPSDPLTLMAAIAATTERVRVGTGIFQLPLHHPLRVAEQVATIDQISGGRISLGVGLGWWPVEFTALGVDIHQRGARMEEALTILRAAWTGEHISFHGKFFDFDDVTVFPRPVQRPNPILQVAGGSVPAVDRAARLGDEWLCSPSEVIDNVVRWITEYRRRRAELGTPPAWVLRRYAWIAPTRQEILEGVLPQYVAGVMGHLRESAEDEANRSVIARMDAGEAVDPAEIADDRILWGAPDDIVAQIKRYEAITGCTHVHVAFAMGLPGAAASYLGDPASITSMVELFGREVISAF
jgi:probable F420-dependent oxidoreductase